MPKSAMSRMLEIFNSKIWKRDEWRKERAMRIVVMEEANYPSPSKRGWEAMELVCGESSMPAEQVADLIEALFILHYDKAVYIYEGLNVAGVAANRNGGYQEHGHAVWEGLICGLVRAAVWKSGEPGNEEFDASLPMTLAGLVGQFARAVYVTCQIGHAPQQKLGGAFANDIAAYLSAKDWPNDSRAESLRRCHAVLGGLSGQDWNLACGAPRGMFSDMLHKALACVPPNQAVQALRGCFQGDAGGFDESALLKCYSIVEGVWLESPEEEERGRRVSLCFASEEEADAFFEYFLLSHYDGGSPENGIRLRYKEARATPCPSVPDSLHGEDVVCELKPKDIGRLMSWLPNMCRTWDAELSKMPVPEFGTRHGAIAFKWDKPSSLNLPEKDK